MAPIETPDREAIMALRIKKAEFVGKGCLVQGLGVLCPCVGLMAGTIGMMVGLVGGLGLLLYGRRLSIVWRCGNCKNAIMDGEVAICPVCKASLTK